MTSDRSRVAAVALVAGSFALAGCSIFGGSEPAPAAGRAGWIVDAATGCGTTNTYPQPDETIGWYGPCRRGRLDGYGTLIWYRAGRETERNEGSFAAGEFDGRVLTSYADGRLIVGDYSDGRRDGAFHVVQPDGRHLRALYRDGALIEESESTPAAFREWLSRQPATRVMTALQVALARLPGNAARAAAALPPVAPPPRRWITIEEFHRGGVPRPADGKGRTAAPGDRSWISTDEFHYPGTRTGPPPEPVSTLFRPIAADAATALRAATLDLRGAAPRIVPAFAEGPALRVASATAGDAFRIETVVVEGTPPDATAVPGRITLRPPAALRLPLPEAAPGADAERQIADAVFAEGFRSERAGNLGRAREAYERLLLDYPSAPAAMLANERLRGLDAARAPPFAPAIAGTAESDVLAVNSPRPAAALRAAASPGGPQPGPDALSAAVSRSVCTDHGLYEHDSGWCGVVIRESPETYWVEVRDVRLRGFGTFGIERSGCTGNTLLTWFSQGVTVHVPKACMVFAENTSGRRRR